MLDRSAVGQLSSLSSRTKWQRLTAGDTLRSLVYRLRPVVNRCHFVQQLTCLTLGRPNGRADSTGELFVAGVIGPTLAYMLHLFSISLRFRFVFFGKFCCNFLVYVSVFIINKNTGLSQAVESTYVSGLRTSLQSTSVSSSNTTA